VSAVLNLLNSQEARSFYIRAAYKIILHREPDSSGAGYFLNRINSGVSTYKSLPVELLSSVEFLTYVENVTGGTVNLNDPNSSTANIIRSIIQ